MPDTGTDREVPYGPGVLAGVEYSPEPTYTEKGESDDDGKVKFQLTSQEVSEIKQMCVDVGKRDYPARLIEVIQAWEAALFYRGFQFLIPRRGGGWIIPGESTGYGPSMQLDLSLLPTNIYGAHAQIIISALTRSVPNARFEPQDITKDAQITAADSAGNFLKVFRRNIDPVVSQTDAARYLWNDGRFLYWTRYERDGQRFGWQEDDQPDDILPENEPPEGSSTATDRVETEAAESGTPENPEQYQGPEEEQFPQRTPNGQEVRTAHGKLEVKIAPMVANDLDQTDGLQFEYEVDVSRAKGMFPERAKDIKAGSTGTTEGEIARLARINVKLGMQSTYITANSIADDVTIQRTWFKPNYLMRAKDEKVRDSLIKKFPDGMKVIYCGETFIHAQNESMKDAWALGQAFSGDGQNRNALGTSYIPAQKRLNNWLDLMNDYFVRTVPKKWMDSKAFAVDAIRQQTNIPGDIGSFKRQPGVPVNELIFIEPQVTENSSLPDFVKQYAGPLAELLTGAYPALSGGDTGTNDTARGIAIQRDQALGRLGQTWHSVKNAEAASSRQAVRWASKCREGTINERVPGGEVIKLEVNDLKANIMCYAESDENFPESYPQKQQRVMGIYDSATKNPLTQEVLFNAMNLKFLKSMWGLSEIYIPQVTSLEKQLAEIDLLMKAEPVPNPAIDEAEKQIQQLKASGMDPQHLLAAEQQLAELKQTKPEVSSIPVDWQTEDNETEAATCWMFMNGPEGRKAKTHSPRNFLNVRLHFMETVEGAQKKAAGAGAQGKPPSESINFKDLPPEGQVQLAAKGGIKIAPPAPPTPAALPAAAPVQ